MVVVVVVVVVVVLRVNTVRCMIPSVQPFATMHRYLKAIGDVDTTKLPKWTSLHCVAPTPIPIC